MSPTTTMTSSTQTPLDPTITFEQRLAFNYLGDVSRAIGAYSRGDRSLVTLRTIAQGKEAFDAVGWNVPRPMNVSAKDWPDVLDGIAAEFGSAAERIGVESGV